MEEQDDSKKRAATKLPEVFRRMKRPTNGPIPDVVRNSNGDMYIVRELKEEMRGKKIPEDMVVRAANARWFTKNEVENFARDEEHTALSNVRCLHTLLQEWPGAYVVSKVQK
jgi:hypothetical protein